MFFDCRQPANRDRGLAAAVTAVQEGHLVVFPTDTVYGLGADAFKPGAIQGVLDAKGRGRHMPPPVLVDSRATMTQLALTLPDSARDLADAFWPGALTLVLRHDPAVPLDLGDFGGTVAVRMPQHPLTLELLRRTGPMAVSSANLTGQPSATTAAEARGQLGDAVRVYLEAGPSLDPIPSTIVDLTRAQPRVLRVGAIPLEKLGDVVPALIRPDEVS